MESISFQLILCLILTAFVSLVLGIGFYIIKRCGSPFPKLFYEFDKKLWMTLGLGLIFFGFYFSSIILIAKFVEATYLQSLFSFFYHHKTVAIYLGLLLFSLVSLSIYLARLFIKYLYAKKKNY